MKLTDEQFDWVTKYILDAPATDSSDTEEHLDAYSESARAGQPGIDLGEPPTQLADRLKPGAKGMISSQSWDEVAKTLDKDYQTFLKDYDAKVDAAQKKGTAFEKIQAMLPVLNGPSNNPERDKVGKQLKDFEAKRDQFNCDIAAESDPGKKKELQQQLVYARSEHLADVEMTLNAWLNRRTQQGLPPCPEALGLADLVQNEHRDLVASCIDDDVFPPVTGMTSLTDKEIAGLEKSWDDLLNQRGSVILRTDASGATGFEKEMRDKLELKGTIVDDAKMEKLRIQVLADMHRLMGSASGRDLVDQMQTADKKICFSLHTSPACACPVAGKVTPPTAGAGPVKGVGSDTLVLLPLDLKDSDHLLRTKDGNLLFTPTHVAIGHEMVHALHGTQGMNLKNIPMGAIDAYWNNPEEYFTINRGELSEQTLRNDYGLSAERFGHVTPPTKDDVVDKVMAAAAKSKELADLSAESEGKKAVDVDSILINERGFGNKVVAMMDDTTKVNIYNDGDAKGPLPNGWDPVRLSVTNLKLIVKNKLPYRMTMLGWTAYDLPYDGGAENSKTGFKDSLAVITKCRVHHQRTSACREFTALGAKKTIGQFNAFTLATGTYLGVWSDKDWRANLRTLKSADRQLDKMIETVPFIMAAPTKPDTKNKLATKLTKISALFTSELAGDAVIAGPLFANDAVAHFNIKEVETDEQLTALKAKKQSLDAKAAKLKLAEGGLTLANLSLVDLDEAVSAFQDFASGKRTKKARGLLREVLEAESPKTRASKYQAALGEIETINRYLWGIRDRSVADAVDKVMLSDLRDLEYDVMEMPEFDKLIEDLEDVHETQADGIYKSVSPKIRDILDNPVSELAFQNYLDSRFLSDVYKLHGYLKGRDTVRIADIAQGDSLIKAGFTQDTIVTLGRDAEDSAALSKAMDQAIAIMQKAVPEFISSLSGV